MHRPLRLPAVLAMTAALLLTLGLGTAAARPRKRVCAVPGASARARCDAEVVTDANGNPLATTGPSGYAPGDLQSAYGVASLAASAGGDKTVAIVDAYDDPRAESDLGVYRSQYGLPACTTANGCFRKVNQSGGTS